MAGIAQALDFVNLEEAAGLMQKQLVQLVDALAEDDSSLQKEMLELFYEKAEMLGQDPEFRELIAGMKEEVLRELPLSEAICRTLDNICKGFGAEEGVPAGHLPMFRSRLMDIFGEENVKQFIQEKTAQAAYKQEYERSFENIAGNWVMLVLFILLFAGLATIVLEMIDKDKR